MIDFGIANIAKLAATIIRPIWNKIKKKQEKKDFIKKIKDIIEESERQIQEAVPLIPFEGSEPHASEHEVRFALYKKMIEELEGFLDEMPKDSFLQERVELRNFIRESKEFINLIGPRRSPEGINFYNQMFNRLREIEWIRD